MTTKEKIYLYLATKSKSWRWRRFFEKKLARACGDAANGGFAYSNVIREYYRENHGLEIGYGTFGGCWLNPCLSWADVTIGRYCSVAGELKVKTGNHPMNLYTTHPISYSVEYGAPSVELAHTSGRLDIGHGVWIGERVLIMPGCKKVGNGAIIGGGSVVTHDVPPYATVAGNPARIIRYRFSEDQIKRLEESKWWEKDKDTLNREWKNLNNLLIAKE